MKIKVENHNDEKIIELNDPSVGFYVGPYVWREMFDFTEGCLSNSWFLLQNTMMKMII